MVAEAELILAIVIVLTCAIGVLFIGKRLRIPFIIGYFITGVIVGPFGLHLITEEQVSIPAELGGGLQMNHHVPRLGCPPACGICRKHRAVSWGMVATPSTAIRLNICQTKGQMATKHEKIALGISFYPRGTSSDHTHTCRCGDRRSEYYRDHDDIVHPKSRV